MSIKQYSALTDDIERKLDEADTFAANTSTRLSKDDVFDSVRRRINQHENTTTTGLVYATFLFFTLSSTTLWKCEDFYTKRNIDALLE